MSDAARVFQVHAKPPPLPEIEKVRPRLHTPPPGLTTTTTTCTKSHLLPTPGRRRGDAKEDRADEAEEANGHFSPRASSPASRGRQDGGRADRPPRRNTAPIHIIFRHEAQSILLPKPTIPTRRGHEIIPSGRLALNNPPRCRSASASSGFGLAVAAAAAALAQYQHGHTPVSSPSPPSLFRSRAPWTKLSGAGDPPPTARTAAI